uniref:Uncharacterized protein n=1 Tax=Knipowitschia caucasica TaxID=637954 RepID=A0AAV2MA48_KNICA
MRASLNREESSPSLQLIVFVESQDSSELTEPFQTLTVRSHYKSLCVGPGPGTALSVWQVFGQWNGQNSVSCPRDRGKRAGCLLQTHDVCLAPVSVPTAHRSHMGVLPGTGRSGSH